MEVETSISLLDSLDEPSDWLKLPHAIMKEVGPAAQTFAGLFEETNRETFSPVATIAEQAYLPIATVRKHLASLDKASWIRRQGRQQTRAGRLRRTATISITKKARKHLEPYSALPWWACCQVRHVGRLPWSSKAVLSVIMSRLMSLKKAVVDQEDHGLDPDDFEGSIENMGGSDRFRFSLNKLHEATGLRSEAIVKAKRNLERLGIVLLQEEGGAEGSKWPRGKATPTGVLMPNWNFRVLVTPADGGRDLLDFDSRAECE